MIKKISEEIYNKIDYVKSIVSIYPDEAIKISKEAYNLAKDNNLIIEEAYSLLSIAFASRIKSDISSIIDSSYKALAIFKDKNYIIGQIKSLNLIGIAYFYSSMYEEAIKYFLEGHELLKTTKDDSLLCSVLNNIGEVYRESEMYDKAIYYYDQAIEIVCKNNYTIHHAAILTNIGEIYFAKSDYKKALEIYNESYNLLIHENDIINLAEIENKIGKSHFEMGNIKKAKEYYFKALKRLQNINNKYYIIDVFINIAEINLEASEGSTLSFYEKAMGFAEDVGSKSKLCKVYKLISLYHEEQGDYKNALEYFKRYSSIKEEIMRVKLKSKLEILNIEFKNIEDKDKFDNMKLRLENEISRQKYNLKKIKSSNEMLERQVYEDELTGIQNRRSVNLYLSLMLKDMKSKEDLIALYVIDIDKFKKYNDCWGHPEGDQCIKKVANCIKSIQLDRDDIFGRYGGEEFIYISTHLDYKEALELGNHIRKEVEELDLYYMDKKEKRTVTISLGGVIGKSSNFSSMQKMIEIADMELYRAKDMGRNRTILKNINNVN
ncbi:tetratricopeptide repeat-containing diguanylate cyclase [Senegalia sp. (in: firmicutes)]|uniref:tetratricopeptide repeat-containing diguanylate cyclase n=5 Tax=Senegalia sp. (in: firmicutes) TaxID=1924098 RepID=UPI003F9A3232